MKGGKNIRYGQKGAITVFLSLISILILSLICTLLESARVQGAQASAAAALDIGLFDLFGEYEKDLLEEYDVFLMNSSDDTGKWEIASMEQRLQEFISYNISPLDNPDEDKHLGLLPLHLEKVIISQYALVTDNKGSAFYQQAVSNMKENIGAELVQALVKNQQEALRNDENSKKYEEYERNNIRDIEELESETSEAATENDEKVIIQDDIFKKIKQLKEMGILELVIPNTDLISNQEIQKASLPSGRHLAAGNLEIKNEHSGVIADSLFQEYLLDHFPNYLTNQDSGSLKYQLEYIMMGKENDIDNLKAVVHRLLLMREGSNFASAVSNSGMREQALVLAASLTALLPIPGLVTLTQTALLLAWAYGESLLDVRTLLSGGKVPYVKNAESWRLSLNNLGNLLEILNESEQDDGHGQEYKDYLRLLLYLCQKENYPMRALDMLEGHLNEKEGDMSICADAFVIKIEAEAVFYVKPLFFNRSEGLYYHINGKFGY